MKRRNCILLLAAVILLSGGCKESADDSDYRGKPGTEQEKEEPEKKYEPALKDSTGWKTTRIDRGLIWYNHEKMYVPFISYQIVNVLELDLNDSGYRVEVVFARPSDKLSNVVRKHGAVAGINGTYELDASFIKSGGTVCSQVTLQPGHLRFWKHEGAFFCDGAADAAIAYGDNALYLASAAPYILSGAPMLIDDYDPVGGTFIGDVAGINLNTLEYEDYRRHQGVRHPRTAVALTENNRLLLITVDGRWSQAAGMSAAELTGFLTRYFKPRYALNIDGGGSTTMYITDGVVNYPTDNGVFDHDGERSVSSFILIKRNA